MDLLKGYDSDSSSSKHDEDAAAAADRIPYKLQRENFTATTTATDSANHTAHHPNDGIIISQKQSQSSVAAVADTRHYLGPQEKRRGKKLLKLQAVLPQHIWNQLTKTGGDTTGGSSGDDDDDDDDYPVPTRPSSSDKMSKKSTPLLPASFHHPHHHPQAASSSELFDLLKALPKSKNACTSSSSSSFILGSSTIESVGTERTNTSSLQQVSNKEESSVSSGGRGRERGLGSAFVTSTVEVTRKVRQGTADSNVTAVRSIHDPDPVQENWTPKSENVITTKERVQTTVAEGYYKDEKQSTVPSSSSSSFPAPSYQQSLTPRPSDYLRPAAAIPTTRRMAAAPTTVSRGTVGTAPVPPSTRFHQMQQQQPQQFHAANTSTNKKSRIRQVEAMLRAGNLGGVVDSEYSIHLEGSGGGSYDYASQALAAQSHASASSGTSSNTVRHGVRVVPTAIYDPSTGQMTASTVLTGKQRGKNQLGALLQNAASLEASRLQNPVSSLLPGSTSSGSGTNPHRNNAKRKYGW